MEMYKCKICGCLVSKRKSLSIGLGERVCKKHDEKDIRYKRDMNTELWLWIESDEEWNNIYHDLD